MSARRLVVLITGGSGYVGQFLLQSLAHKHELHYTYNTRRLQSAPDGVQAHQLDLVTPGEGLQQLFSQVTFHVVINCAAVSQPGACESAPARARAVNVPVRLLDCVEAQAAERGVRALLVHLSTDQVYDGSHSYWKEDEPCLPINVYGRTKLEAEEAILSRLPQPHPVAILRCSIIYGPRTPDPTPGTPFLQFVVSSLRKGTPTPFFEDEWRNPVYVGDVVRLVETLIARDAPKPALEAAAPAPATAGGEVAPREEGFGPGAGEPAGAVVEAAKLEGGTAGGAGGTKTAAAGVIREGTASSEADEAAPAEGETPSCNTRNFRVYNMGGPERLSRVDMARLVAECLGCSPGPILPVPSSSAPSTIPRPADISVDISRLKADLDFRPVSMKDALAQIAVALKQE